jgi:ABC-2 type transport system ATP-binding protein
MRASTKVMRRDAPNPWRWVLRDIDFSIQPGEAVGLVGANGAGKSTLLKIISGVMFPYSGRVTVNGRIGALLEVASGIHPDLTGKENINIFGMLLGLGRKEITEKYDEIVAFAELENAINRQTKFYSSGMKTRLGFAIAAFLEPEVLIVDEVLAVGDQLFQQKCLDRMRAVLDRGTTLILVSHDLASVGATATRGIWLSEGMMRADGPIDEVLGGYRRDIEARSAETAELRGTVQVHSLSVTPVDSPRIESGGSARFEFSLANTESRFVELYLGVSQGPATPIFAVTRQCELTPGQSRAGVTIASLPLPAGSFYCWVAVRDPVRKRDLTPWQPLGPFAVHGSGRLDPLPRAIVRLAPVYVEADWNVDATT